MVQSVAELLILYSQKHKMWSFSLKFGELIYENVNFHDKTTHKKTQSHARLELPAISMSFNFANFFKAVSKT